MSTRMPSRTRLLFRIVSWTGAGFMTVGTLGTVWSTVTFVQVRTGWGLTAHERCCVELGKAALGSELASMFFFLVGSGVILLLHPVRAHLARESGKRPTRRLKVLAFVLLIYSIAVFTLATVLAGMAEDLDGFAAGIVTYCMLVGVGMLTAAWGFKRASEVL